MKMSGTQKFGLIAMALAIGIGTLGIGCNQSEPNPSKDSTGDSNATPSNVKLSVVDWEGDAMNVAVKEALANFTSDTGIEVELQAAPLGDYKTSLNSMMMAGEAPDIYQSAHDWALSFYQEGLTYNWAEYAKEDSEFVKGFYPGSYELWQTPEGALVGFPNAVNVYGIWYNVDLLEAAGLEAPKEGWKYDDLFAMAEKLADPANGKYGLYGLPLDAFSINVMSVANGGEPFVNDFAFPTAIQVDDEFNSMVKKISELIEAKVLPETTYEVANIQSTFTEGSVALLSYGQWLISDLINSDIDFEYGYAPNPTGSTGKQVSIFDPVGWCSPKDVEHPDETWELLKFVSSEMYSTVLPVTPVAACAYVEDSKAFFDTITEAGHPESANAVETMMSADTYMPVRFLMPWANDVLKIWNPAYNGILDGQADISTLPGIVDQVNDFIANQ